MVVPISDCTDDARILLNKFRDVGQPRNSKVISESRHNRKRPSKLLAVDEYNAWNWSSCAQAATSSMYFKRQKHDVHDSSSHNHDGMPALLFHDPLSQYPESTQTDDLFQFADVTINCDEEKPALETACPQRLDSFTCGSINSNVDEDSTPTQTEANSDLFEALDSEVNITNPSLLNGLEGKAPTAHRNSSTLSHQATMPSQLSPVDDDEVADWLFSD